jgi:hypothetical protein
VAEYISRVDRSGEASGLAAIRRELELLASAGPVLGMPHESLILPRLGIRELRPGDHRIAYVGRPEEIVLLHAWRKRTQKLDQREARRAKLNLERYLDADREAQR